MKLEMTEKVPEFAFSYPNIAETFDQIRLPFYCMNCLEKGPTGWVTPNFGPLCARCAEEIP